MQRRGLIHTRLRPLLRPLMRVPLVRGSGGFSPSQVFAGNAAGMWLDQSDITTGFQDSVGTTPQTASGQQTGLRLDKRLGLALSAEVITVAADRDFSSDTGFWSKDAGVTIGGGAANWAATAATFQLFRNGLLTVGKYYEFTYTVSNFSLGGIRLGFGAANTGTTRSAAGTYTERIVADGTRLAFISVGASTTLSIDNVSVKEVTGNHVLQATGSTRPEWDVIGNISSDFCDGLDDGYSTATFVAGTLTSNMDCFITMKRATTAQMVTCSNGSPNFFGVIQAGGVTAGSAAAVVGSAWTCFVNAVEVGAGPNTASRDGLNTAMGSGAYKVMEFRNLDLSAWTGFTISLYASFLLNADIAQIVLCPAQSTAVRNQIRTYCGAKGGLSL